MKILHPLLSNCVTRLDITFADSNGHEKKIWGTGFWIKQSDNNLVLVTNRHNFEPSLKKFEGSSGSPVFFLPKGLNLTGGSGIISILRTPLQNVGIMPGHWEDNKSFNNSFLHSGLSYLTKATAIYELLSSCGIPLREFIHPIHCMAKI